MKVISGLYKGRVLEGYNIEGTRPTMDRVKESLFAMIQNHIPNSTVLDLFSGSGNLGIESLSQGASFAYLVEKEKKAIDAMKKNIEKLSIKNCQVIWNDYKKALDILKENNIQVDIIFLDPPYQTDLIEKSIQFIEENHILKENGIIVCESDQLDKIIYNNHYQKSKEKKYGDKHIVIIKKIC